VKPKEDPKVEDPATHHGKHSNHQARTGMKAIFDALNIIYDEEEKRGFIWLNVVSLFFTICVIAGAGLAVALVVVFPLLTAIFGLTSLDTLIIAYLRWPLMFASRGVRDTMAGSSQGLAALRDFDPVFVSSRSKAPECEPQPTVGYFRSPPKPDVRRCRGRPHLGFGSQDRILPPGWRVDFPTEKIPSGRGLTPTSRRRERSLRRR
jgi:hypothetical protein